MKKNVKRLGKSALALFLAGVLAFTPAGEAFAAGNVTTVVETEILATTEPKYTFFNPDSIFLYEYIYDGEVIPHILFTPSISDENRPQPLIVWLHGTGERNANKLEVFV